MLKKKNENELRVITEEIVKETKKLLKEEVSRYRKQISKVASRIGLENDIEISLLLRDKDTFERGGEVRPFYKNIQKEGVALYG